MSGQPPTSASVAQGARAEALYGTDHYQVRLWHLPPGTILPAHPAKSSETSQILLIKGRLDGLQNGQSQPLEPGHRRVLSGQSPAQLTSSGVTEALMLEVTWGQGYPDIPLGEVTETRPWGSFTVLRDEPDYKLKQLIVNPGCRLSLQRHQKRAEHWIITQGDPAVTLDAKIHSLQAGQYIHIPLHSWHRITNPASKNGASVELIELQLGEYFGEDDIERQEDDYGRA